MYYNIFSSPKMGISSVSNNNKFNSYRVITCFRPFMGDIIFQTAY